MWFKKKYIYLLGLSLLSGCGLTTKVNNNGLASVNSSSPKIEIKVPQINIDEDDSSNTKLFRNMEDVISKLAVDPSLSLDGLAAPRPTPLKENKYKGLIRKWLIYFSIKNPDRFQRYLDRGKIYSEVVQSILIENDLPPDLYYLAMIESGYVTNAKSRASAVGIWQFIRSTGRRYGLESNYYIDERQDPIRSTEAAARYLRGLYTAFESWELALASYNAGEYGMLRRIINGKTKDYWQLSKMGVLPRETKNYVPKFMAAAIIGRNPARYGFTVQTDPEEFPNVVAAEVPSPIKLTDVAKLISVPYKILKKINPHIKRGVTPHNSTSYELWVPEGKEVIGPELKKKLAQHKLKKNSRTRTANNYNRNYYKVRKGDSLSVIAERFKISVSHLKRLNHLRSNRIRAGARLRISAKSYNRAILLKNFYLVKRGDTLGRIARQHKISISSLKKINLLGSNRIFPGMKLKISSL